MYIKSNYISNLPVQKQCAISIILVTIINLYYAISEAKNYSIGKSYKIFTKYLFFVIISFDEIIAQLLSFSFIMI